METTHVPATSSRSRPRSPLTVLWSHWPRWVTWGAIVWSAVYATFGVVWWAGWRWYPFGPVSDDRSSASIFEGASPQLMGPLFTVLGLLGVVSGLVMLQERATPLLRRAATGYGIVAALLCTVLVPDYTPLAVLAMWPAMVVFAFTGVPGAQHGIEDILYWHRVNVLLIFVGGLLWVGATLAHHRRTRSACAHCGRSERRSAPDRRRLLVWGRAGVWLAVLSTIPYDVTRLAWCLGWPLGLSPSTYESLQHPDELLILGLVLSLMATGGAMLTHGLVARWGERFPWWIPRYAGRRVPVMLAVIPASLVCVVLPAGTMTYLNAEVNGGYSAEDWGTWVPSLFWLVWAVGLGLATCCYYLRRRSACRRCGRGDG